jgi:hypothetical protein
MSVFIPYLRWSQFDRQPEFHWIKDIVNCLVSKLIESKYEFRVITRLKGTPQLQMIELRGY